jgi:capsid protein
MIGYTSSAYKAAEFPFDKTPVSARIDENLHLTRYLTLERMISRAKHLARNNFFVKALQNVMIDYVVGATGPTPVGGDPEHRAAWFAWANSHCDVQGRRTLVQLTREIVGQWVVSDVLAVMVADTDLPGARVQQRLSLIDGSRVRTPGQFAIADGSAIIPKGYAGAGNTITLGIEFNSFGREIAYWVAPSNGQNDDASAYKRIPRYDPKTGRFVSFLLRRPDGDNVAALRTIPMFASVMPEIEDNAICADSATQMGIARSKLGLIITTANPDDARKALGGLRDDGEVRAGANVDGQIVNYGLVSDGAAMMMPEATGVHTISHSGNIDIVALMVQNLRHAAAGVDVPYEILMSNFVGINFSSGKLSYDKFYRKVGAWVQTICMFYSELYSAINLEADLLRGVTPTAASVRRWIGPAVPDPDPTKSSMSDLRLRDSALKSSSEIVAYRYGMDYTDHLLQVAEDRAMEEAILGRETPSSQMLYAQPEEVDQPETNTEGE